MKKKQCPGATGLKGKLIRDIAIVGHRANHPRTISYYVENHVDYIELDLKLAGKKIVVRHGEGLASSTTLSEFFFKLILNRLMGKDLLLRPLSLEDALNLIPVDMGLWIDIKDRLTGFQSVERSLGFGFKKIVVSANYYGFLREIKRGFPSVKTAISVSFEPSDLEELADMARKSSADIVAVEYPYFSHRLSSVLKGKGFETAVWTVNNPGVARRIIEMRPDYLITDRPELIRKVFISFVR